MRYHPGCGGTGTAGPWDASAGPEGMATMMRYTFRTLITLSPKVPEDPAPCCPGRAHVLAACGCYIIQPFSCHGYLPAMISLATVSSPAVRHRPGLPSMATGSPGMRPIRR